MTDLEEKHPDKDLSFHNSLARYVAVKEEHAIKCKEEIRVIWGDYIKPNHVKEFPEVHALVHKIMQLGSKTRQTVSRETAVELLEAVNQFAEMFWKTKGIATKRAKAPYAPAEEVVYPAL
jgi:nickel superoxide dismutase